MRTIYKSQTPEELHLQTNMKEKFTEKKTGSCYSTLPRFEKFCTIHLFCSSHHFRFYKVVSLLFQEMLQMKTFEVGYVVVFLFKFKQENNKTASKMAFNIDIELDITDKMVLFFFFFFFLILCLRNKGNKTEMHIEGGVAFFYFILCVNGGGGGKKLLTEKEVTSTTSLPRLPSANEPEKVDLFLSRLGCLPAALRSTALHDYLDMPSQIRLGLKYVAEKSHGKAIKNGLLQLHPRFVNRPPIARFVI
ncbi:hypothetical protein RFI_37023, partial [Reticulomyxa filosa]